MFIWSSLFWWLYSTIPPPHTLPYYPRTKHPACPLSQFKTIGGDSLPWSAAAKLMIDARQHRLCLSSCSSLPAPWPAKISHLASHPHNTLAYKLSLFTCLSNNIPLRGVLTTLMALHVGSKVFTPECESPHALAKYTKEPWLYPPPPLTKERSSVGRSQAPHRLSSHWCPFSIHSLNGLGHIVQIYV